MARPVRGHAVRAACEEIADTIVASGLKARGASRSATGAVVEADLQRGGEPGRSTHRPPARLPLRAGGRAERPRPPRPRPRRRGQGGRGGGRHRAARRPVGDERARDQRGSAHYPSMLEDVDAQRETEIELITGSLVREAERHDVPVPLHTMLYELVRGKEASWQALDRRAEMISREEAALARARCGGGRGGRRRMRRVSGAAAGEDGHDRLGVRQRRRDGAVRRPGARDREDSHHAGERGPARRSSGSSPATRRATSPPIAKSCAARLLGQGADVIMTTCDVDLAAPVVQEAINAGS